MYATVRCHNTAPDRYVIMSAMCATYIVSKRRQLGQCDNYNRKSHRRCNNMSRMNLSGYVGRVTIFSSVFTIASCLVVELGLELGLGLESTSGWLVVMHTHLCDYTL